MKILVIAAHPDDEVLGCGGTLFKLSKDMKNQLFFAFAADGVMGRHRLEEKEKFLSDIERRRQESVLVAKILKAEILNKQDKNYYRFNDQRLAQEDFNNVVGWIKDKIEKSKPDIIYTHFVGDFNIDHRIVAEAVLVAARPSKFEFVKKIYAFEVNMADTNQGSAVQLLPFNPNVFEKISINKTLGKIGLFKYYKSEQWATWQADIETLAKYRGTNSGFDFAEGFLLLRQRND
ncbi:MAG: PIG-L family deacetylase [Patescibacteria group bacterium]